MRDTIKDILLALPGYKGYEELEHRRESDKVLRMHLAQQYSRERDALTRLTQKAVNMGKIGHLDRIEEIIQMLNRFIGRLESAPRGYASWFSATQITPADLDRIYEFDTQMADNIPLLQEQIGHAEEQLKSGEAFDNALDELKSFVDGLNTQYDARQELLAPGNQPV
jgi:septation ring formation regulator EzrA